ncbi:cytochrome c oxidase subunit 2A [Rhodocytophaga rosea]|uniref:Cytochrome c oxidase subunit 2A n=1 Tax=Rhodocytophaga rosea TaxID=2704465 RepID=A0A6C0GWH6_9BACT|nr:cytochrome c oxidase subunit 2A [Rhodocytophaga rosea]
MYHTKRLIFWLTVFYCFLARTGSEL